MFWLPGTVVAAVHDDRGLRDAGQLTGQVEAQLAGEDIAGRLLADRRPFKEPGAGLIVQRVAERAVEHGRLQVLPDLGRLYATSDST